MANDLTSIPKTVKAKKTQPVKKRTKRVSGEVIRQGRPSIYTQELADEICERLANGESLRKITRDDAMPEGRTVWKWLRVKPDFVQQYAKAKEESADALSEDIQDIADKTLQGLYDPQASRVAIDAYKWSASKLKPKKYGDKLDLTSDGQALPQPIINFQLSQSDTIKDIKRPVIEAEVSQKAGPVPNSNIMDDIK